MQIKILSILKLISSECLAGNDFSERGTQRRLTAKETTNANCEVLDEKYRIVFQGILVGIYIIKAGGLR